MCAQLPIYLTNSQMCVTTFKLIQYNLCVQNPKSHECAAFCTNRDIVVNTKPRSCINVGQNLCMQQVRCAFVDQVTRVHSLTRF